MLENSPQYLAITYALKKIGSIEVSINRTFRGASLARTIKLTNTPVLITSSSHFEAVHAVIGELDNVAILMVLDGEEKAKELFPNQTIVSFETIPVENDSHIYNGTSDLSPASIMFTSGTTGVSKGCANRIPMR